ncbi:hypothetical protein FGG08_006948 [Glutinoglossum americanum]|uniref:Rab-GAP TBC domain-containing protein n=1 Tax=Glutinoglossum americanum TaxID=1670608 RepID=A0A9P8I0A3_9PEZI|nr:hypothetical protein FGG08_006948 [Glutinoglossum americanum]
MVTVRLSDPIMSSSVAPPTLNVIAEVGNPDFLEIDNTRSVRSCTPCTEFQDLDEEREGISQRTSATHITEDPMEELFFASDVPNNRSRSNSAGTDISDGAGVNWDELERTEEKEPRDEGSDESTAFLLARLEQENQALATDPKSGLTKEPEAKSRTRHQSRPPSIHHLKKLVNDVAPSSVRYSLLPAPPPMTELEFYAALVADYPRTAQCLPTLLSKKIRNGIPPPLRELVWMSMSGARDHLLEEQYDQLSGESSPYENLIGKDIGRSFPGVEMFRDPEGEGQRMLGRVLKCFSLYDNKIGYCQGLGFLVGPLLMHMGEKEAFCVLVRLMEHYDLRSCFLPDLSGLHLRIYQFQRLLAQHLPTLSAHLDNLQIEPAYVSQWFLSFFAVTCPLPMLLRIYDVIFAEGASETMMRVALSLMRRNEKTLLACTEIEDAMQLLLSRGLWDTYRCNADDFVNDFVGLTGVVTREGLLALEVSFKEVQSGEANMKSGSVPGLQATASRFLGRLWAGSSVSTNAGSGSLSPGLSLPSRPNSFLRRTPSKQSLTSTLSSYETGSETSIATTCTEITAMSRQSSAQSSLKSTSSSTLSTVIAAKRGGSKDKDLHGQIEDLLTALSEMQRDHAILAAELQKEREEREEDRQLARALVQRIKKIGVLDSVARGSGMGTLAIEEKPAISLEQVEAEGLSAFVDTAEVRFSEGCSRRSAVLETKQQLRSEISKFKDQYRLESARCQDLSRQLTDQDKELCRLKEQVKEARSRVQDGHREKQRLEKTIQELRGRKPASPTSECSSDSLSFSNEGADFRVSTSGGLREFKLGRSGSTRSENRPNFSKRTSSLGMQAVLATDNHTPMAEDALLLELVNAKTAEAVAKQEAEEAKAKLESLRRMLGSSDSGPKPGTIGHRPSPSQPNLEKSATISTLSSYRIAVPTLNPDPAKATAPTSVASGGGFWGGWGKRSVTNPIGG